MHLGHVEGGRFPFREGEGALKDCRHGCGVIFDKLAEVGVAVAEKGREDGDGPG